MNKPELGLATTEEMIHELIARFTIHIPNDVGMHIKNTTRALTLSEMLGSLSTYEREYRTVDNA